MNDRRQGTFSAGVFSFALLAGFLLVGWLVWHLRTGASQPAPLGEERAQVRRKALHDVRTADAEALGSTNYVWLDQPKGIVRLPVSQAMELSVKLWQRPSEARSNLVARAEKAYYVPPPPPNKFD